jgi:uncharacterized protein (TIGR03086 family)
MADLYSTLYPALTSAAREFTVLVRTLEPDELTARTPCSEYDVRGLVNHLLYWGPALEAAARKQDVPAVTPAGEAEADLVHSDWASILVRQADAFVDAYSAPEAWQGTSTMAGLPAATVGAMILMEFVLHGWDLARATGRDLTVPGEVVSATHDGVAGIAEQARGMGIFGPEVPLPVSASLFDRTLSLSGRDPAWVR